MEKTILIVDDLPDNLRVLSSALTGQGFQIRCAKSGAIALMAAQTISPALILLDVIMPDMDGYEVCERLKSNEFTRNIPVIFLSALDEAFDKVKAFNVGGVDYITKPFQVEEVLIRIEHQLALQAAKAEIQQLNEKLEQCVQQRTKQLAITNEKLEIEITERQQAEERLESILNSLEDVVRSLDSDNSHILYLNPAVEKVYGYPVSKFIERPSLWLEVIHPEDRDRIEDANNALLTTGGLCEEYRILRPDGEMRWVSDRGHIIYDTNGKVVRIDGILRDITEQKQVQQQLIHDALHDGLTGLPNRHLFMDRVEQALKHAKRHSDYLFAILFIDLDRFKIINDSFGHAMGDRLLQTIPKLLESCVRSVDTVARLGGDEFTILTDSIHGVSEVVMIAERILNKFAMPVILEGQRIFTGASIGIVISTKDYNSSDDLLRDADIAMYKSKSLGKGRYTIFDREMYEQNLKLMQLDSDLRYALERNEFELYYQPIICLATNKLYGFEALIRWQHPERGLVFPSEFIPVLEDNGLIVAIGDWVLRKASQQLQIWQARFPQAAHLKMSINFASRQIRESNLLEKLDTVLAETGTDGSTLSLEITETTLMDQGEETIDKLGQLRARNIQLSIDDFGQGYSSLSYLHRFPINILKIDRAFINQMTAGEVHLATIRTIILLAHTLNMDVVAEGVENQQQVDMLRQLGCEFVQGYFFSRPLTAIAVEQTIADFLTYEQAKGL